MNTNILGLLLLGGFGFNASEWASGDFCLNHWLQQKIAVNPAQNYFPNRLPSTNNLLCSSPEIPASALAGQTDSPEPIQFGYFPL